MVPDLPDELHDRRSAHACQGASNSQSPPSPAISPPSGDSEEDRAGPKPRRRQGASTVLLAVVNGRANAAGGADRGDGRSCRYEEEPLAKVTDDLFTAQVGRSTAPLGELVNAQLRATVPEYAVVVLTVIVEVAGDPGATAAGVVAANVNTDAVTVRKPFPSLQRNSCLRYSSR